MRDCLLYYEVLGAPCGAPFLVRVSVGVDSESRLAWQAPRSGRSASIYDRLQYYGLIYSYSAGHAKCVNLVNDFLTVQGHLEKV
jgi:hypothetical protein